MANLVVEIGNTALKAALAEGPTLGKTFKGVSTDTMGSPDAFASRMNCL